MATTNGASLIARSLKQQGVDYMFGIVGFPVVPVAIAAQKAGITFIGMRNEQAASYAAQAAGYLLGRPQACLVVSGPGVIHALSGLANAQQNNWPMVLLGGANGLDQNGMGAFQEERQVLATTPFTKYSHVVERAERIPFYVEQAVRTAWYGRPGATYLDLPDDVILAQVDDADVRIAATIPDRAAQPSVRQRRRGRPRGPAQRRASARDRGQGHGVVTRRGRGARLHRQDQAAVPQLADGQGRDARRPSAVGWQRRARTR